MLDAIQRLISLWPICSSIQTGATLLNLFGRSWPKRQIASDLFSRQTLEVCCKSFEQRAFCFRSFLAFVDIKSALEAATEKHCSWLALDNGISLHLSVPSWWNTSVWLDCWEFSPTSLEGHIFSITHLVCRLPILGNLFHERWPKCCIRIPEQAKHAHHVVGNNAPLLSAKFLISW